MCRHFTIVSSEALFRTTPAAPACKKRSASDSDTDDPQTIADVPMCMSRRVFNRAMTA